MVEKSKTYWNRFLWPLDTQKTDEGSVGVSEKLGQSEGETKKVRLL